MTYPVVNLALLTWAYQDFQNTNCSAGSSFACCFQLCNRNIQSKDKLQADTILPILTYTTEITWIESVIYIVWFYVKYVLVI